MLRRAARHVRINARRHPVGPLPRGLATPSSSKDDGTTGAPPPWRQIAILSGSSFVANAGFGCIIPVLPSLSESLSLGAVGVGVILSAPAAARVVLNVHLGALADEIGRRPLMIAGSALGAAGTFATGSAGSLLELVPARLLAGAGSAATLAGAQAYMADVTEGRGDRGKLLGVQQAAVALGFIGGPALGGGLAEVLGPHALFHAVGVCNLLCVAGYALLPETHQGTGIAASDADAAADADTRARLAAAWRGPLPTSCWATRRWRPPRPRRPRATAGGGTRSRASARTGSRPRRPHPAPSTTQVPLIRRAVTAQTRARSDSMRSGPRL